MARRAETAGSTGECPNCDGTYDRYIASYVKAARCVSAVEAIYADTSHGLHIYTLFRGSLFDIGAELIAAEGQVMDEYPGLPVDFQSFPADLVDADHLGSNVRQVFRAA